MKLYYLLFLLIGVQSNFSNQCGYTNKLTCSTDNTCCFFEQGYKCIPVKDGVCCEYGLNKFLTACPKGTVCDTTIGCKLKN